MFFQWDQSARTIAVVALAGLLSACAATKPAGDVRKSGFLGDYSMLRKGKEGQAQLTQNDHELKREKTDD